MMTVNEESVKGKIILEGTLVLAAPLLIGTGGNGAGQDVDDEVLKTKGGQPFIPGTSLAGALRDFMTAENALGMRLLFGTEAAYERQHNAAWQSSIRIDDIKLNNVEIVVRDGVSLDEITGTAIEHHKFDYEAVGSGATGKFFAEITQRGIHERYEDAMKEAVDLLAHRLAAGFSLGAHTAKGFGEVHVRDLKVYRYDFKNPDHVRAWLGSEGKSEALVEPEIYERQKGFYAKDDCVLEAKFALKSSLLVRDYARAMEVKTAERMDDKGTSVQALMLRENDHWLIPGASIKGALRHRAAEILRKLDIDSTLLDCMMGPSLDRIKEKPAEKWKSRLLVSEARLENGVVTGLQTRVRIDRFTGGKIDTALFATAPIWQREKEGAALSLRLVLHEPKEEERAWQIGLLLLLLKELSLGRLALGGEKGIGRGVLEGRGAVLHYHGEEIAWDATPGALTDEERRKLQGFVEALLKKREAKAL